MTNRVEVISSRRYKAMKNQIEVIPARLYVETLDSKPSHLVFYSLLDAAAIVLGVILGGIAWGYSMACFLFG